MMADTASTAAFVVMMMMVVVVVLNVPTLTPSIELDSRDANERMNESVLNVC